MIVEHPDLLRAWLASVLQPLCDADPAALSKYVLALLKKEKPEKELRQSMMDQLDVFLQGETKGFVELLFKNLLSKEYISKALDLAITTSDEGHDLDLLNKHSVENSSESADSMTNTTIDSTLSSNSAASDSLPTGSSQDSIVEISPTKNENKDDKKDHIKIEGGIKEKEKDRPIRRRSRSRSKERDRIRRSRSPRMDRNNRARKYPPPPFRRFERDNWDSRRRFSRSPPPGLGRNKSRSPIHHRRYKRYHPSSRSRSMSRSRSPQQNPSTSTSFKDSSTTIKLENVKKHHPTTMGNQLLGDVKDSLVDSDMISKEDEDGKDVKPNVLRSVIVNTSTGTSSDKEACDDKSKPDDEPYTGGGGGGRSNRCRDFDLKGLCMRGEFCPYDHGADPVVLSDSSLAQGQLLHQMEMEAYPPHHELRNYPPVQYTPQLRGHSNVQFQGGDGYFQNSMPDPWINPPFRGRFIGMRGMRGRGFLPQRPGPPNIEFLNMPPPQRELINVPVMSGGGGHQMDIRGPTNPGMVMGPSFPQHMRGSIHIHGHGGGRGGRGRGRGHGFDHTRLGPRKTFPVINSSLEVKRIPKAFNNIMDLNSHFLRFGKILNIQINYDNDPEAALITFASPIEAQAAYKSTDAVLNNRFIRVFWHSKEKENDSAIEGGSSMNEKVELDQSLLAKNESADPDSIKAKELSDEKSNAKFDQGKPSESVTSQDIKKKKKEALKMQGDLQKRKGEMLQEQIEQQKKLILKMESGRKTMKPEDQEKLMSLIKSLQESIENIKKGIEASNPIVQKQLGHIKSAVVATKEKVQREALDAELDLYQKEQSGEDTLALEKKVSELRIKARAMGYNLPKGKVYRGVPRRFSAMASGKGTSSRKFDRRTTKLRIIGFPKDKASDIVTQFATYGFIKDISRDVENPVPYLIITYDLRKCAEMAFIKGRKFQDMDLKITWLKSGEVDSSTSPAAVDSKQIAKEESEQSSSGSKAINLRPDVAPTNQDKLTDNEDEFADLLNDEILLQYEDDEDEHGEGEGDRSWRR